MLASDNSCTLKFLQSWTEKNAKTWIFIPTSFDPYVFSKFGWKTSKVFLPSGCDNLVKIRSRCTKHLNATNTL